MYGGLLFEIQPETMAKLLARGQRLLIRIDSNRGFTEFRITQKDRATSEKFSQSYLISYSDRITSRHLETALEAASQSVRSKVETLRAERLIESFEEAEDE